MDWRNRIEIPTGINTLWGPARVSTMVRLLGAPEGKLTTRCGGRERVSARIRDKIITHSVGPFKLTGFEPFIETWRAVMREYRTYFPEEYNDLTTAGCLCVRLVRGSKSSPSNHSWGTAVDVGYGGVIDRRGDGMCYKGLLNLYSVAKRYKLYWGAGFNTEDAMHFEASEDLIREWYANGSVLPT